MKPVGHLANGVECFLPEGGRVERCLIGMIVNKFIHYVVVTFSAKLGDSELEIRFYIDPTFIRNKHQLERVVDQEHSLESLKVRIIGVSY